MKRAHRPLTKGFTITDIDDIPKEEKQIEEESVVQEEMWVVKVGSLNRRRNPGMSGEIMQPPLKKGDKFSIESTTVVGNITWGKMVNNEGWVSLLEFCERL